MEILNSPTLLQNSLLVDNFFVNPPAVADYSAYSNMVTSSFTYKEVEDYVEISDEAYKKTILEGVRLVTSPTAYYNNDFNNLVVNYLNKT